MEAERDSLQELPEPSQLTNASVKKADRTPTLARRSAESAAVAAAVTVAVTFVQWLAGRGRSDPSAVSTRTSRKQRKV